jgi:hypothetical protein
LFHQNFQLQRLQKRQKGTLMTLNQQQNEIFKWEV